MLPCAVYQCYAIVNLRHHAGGTFVHINAISQVVYNFATTGAIAVGGVWAYFKFLRGRTFSYRAEVSVTARVEERAGWLYVNVTIQIRNTGLSKVPLNDDMKYLQLYGMESGNSGSPAMTEWRRLLTSKIFDQHRLVEAQEVVTDTIALRLPRDISADHHAYKVEAWLGARLNRVTRKGHLWHARGIVFAPADSSERVHAISNGGRSLIDRILDR